MEAKRVADTCTAGLEHFQRQLDELRTTSSAPAATLESLSSEFAEFRTRIYNMLGSLQAKTEDLEYRVQHLEAKGRRNTLLIHGVKEDAAIAPSVAALNVIVGKLGCLSIADSGLNACYRLGQIVAKRSTPRPIVVKFASRDDRYLVWSKKKALKGTRTLITESLIRPRQQLFTEARAIFKANNTWTKDGKIVVMFPDGDTSLIWRMDQLDQAKTRLSSLLGTQKNESRSMRPRPKK